MSLHKCILCCSWDMARDRCNCCFFHFGLFVALLTPPLPNNPKNQNEKIDLETSLYTLYINDNHMMYGSWCMEHDKQNFLSFWTFFSPFPPLTTHEIKIKKTKQKKPPGDIILHKCNINDNQMMYCSWDLKCDGTQKS